VEQKMRWSKLQREFYKIAADEINLQIHCSAYPMESQRGHTAIPRYWITLDKEIIFDYPKQFITDSRVVENFPGSESRYPYKTDTSDISDLIREYIDTPKEEILSKQFPNDSWGLIDILHAADRRIGTRRLEALLNETGNISASKVLKARLADERIDDTTL
jgi:hypothetical protein